MSAGARSRNNLAYCFQEVLTATLRMRSQRQPLTDPTSFRTQMRRLLQTAMTEAKGLGYPSQDIQMAVLAAVGFLDESVLNLQGPAVAEWTRRPLQEELFGGHVAGETVFANFAQLLNRQDGAETADVLELHCLCLELGYKGRYAFGSGGEIRQLIAQGREKIRRIRGDAGLWPLPSAPPAPAPVRSDAVGRGLLVTAAALAVLTLAAFAGYQVSLSAGASHLESTSLVSR